MLAALHVLLPLAPLCALTCNTWHRGCTTRQPHNMSHAQHVQCTTPVNLHYVEGGTDHTLLRDWPSLFCALFSCLNGQNINLISHPSSLSKHLALHDPGFRKSRHVTLGYRTVQISPDLARANIPLCCEVICAYGTPNTDVRLLVRADALQGGYMIDCSSSSTA